jgi:hypothetical protein
MDAATLKERYTIGGLFLLGKDGFRKLLDEHFGGQVPEPGTGPWVGFVFAVAEAPHNAWLRTWFPQPPSDAFYEYTRLPEPTMPAFPKELSAVDHFHPYNAHLLPQTEAEKKAGKKPTWNAGFRPTSVEPFQIGLWASPDIRNPYKHADNADAFDNGRALARSRHAETYKKYIAACRKACKAAWGEGARVP